MIDWPTGVNKIIINETTGEWGDGLIRDKLRSGKEKVRLSTSTPYDTHPVVMIMTREELGIFESWYKNDLRRGAITFEFPTIAGTGSSEYRIVPRVKWSQWGRDTVKVQMTWERLA